MDTPCLGQYQSTISNSPHKLKWNNADKGPCPSTQLANIKCWLQDYDLKNLLVKTGIQWMNVKYTIKCKWFFVHSLLPFFRPHLVIKHWYPSTTGNTLHTKTNMQASVNVINDVHYMHIHYKLLWQGLTT